MDNQEETSRDGKSDTEEYSRNRDNYWKQLSQYLPTTIGSGGKRPADDSPPSTPAKIAKTSEDCIGATIDENLLTLPSELVDHIFGFLPFTELARLRSVSEHFNSTCQRHLNRGFSKLQNNTQMRYQQIKSQMPRRESARRKHPLSRECDIMETLHMRLTLLQMTFGKHIEKGHCCFFAGEILDEVYKILDYVKSTPTLSRAYKVTDELFDLSTMAMEYFKEHIEPNLPEINYFSTDFPDLPSSITTTPNSRPYIVGMGNSPRVETPVLDGILGNSPCQQSVGTPDTPTQSGSIHKIRVLQRKVHSQSSQISGLRKEVSGCRRKIAYQKKLLQGVTSQLSQHEKKFEEQNKKIEALVLELRQTKPTPLQTFKTVPNVRKNSTETNVDSLYTITSKDYTFVLPKRVQSSEEVERGVGPSVSDSVSP